MADNYRPDDNRPNRYGSARQMPCPDCGSPVQPERDQLCPKCGYPLMFLRQNGGHDAEAKSVPRRPNEQDDPTSMRAVPQPRTSSFPAGTYGTPPGTYGTPAGVSGGVSGGPVQCRTCGYPNEPARFRCERCGSELRQSRPYARTLAPPSPQATPRRAGGWFWLVALIILAVLAVIALVGTLAWLYLT